MSLNRISVFFRGVSGDFVIGILTVSAVLGTVIKVSVKFIHFSMKDSIPCNINSPIVNPTVIPIMLSLEETLGPNMRGNSSPATVNIVNIDENCQYQQTLCV